MEILTLIINLLPELIPLLTAIGGFLIAIKAEVAKLTTSIQENTSTQKELSTHVVEIQKQQAQMQQRLDDHILDTHIHNK